MKDKIYTTLYGAIVADAVGVPVEFLSREELKENPVTDMRGFGTFYLPKGSWSDDSSMMLCLADSIGIQGRIDYEDIMSRFWEWYKNSKYTPDNDTFDIGRTCHKAIKNFHTGKAPLDCGLTSESDNGNGSLMRIAPLPLYVFQKFGSSAMDNEKSFELIHDISRLTHGHEISLIGCDIYCSIMIEILKGTQKDSLQNCGLEKIAAYVRKYPQYEQALQKYEGIFHTNFKNIPEEEIKSSGYIVDTLETALWCFLNTDNYRGCVLKAVNLGADTDTVACVAGSIAGLYYGDIPKEWIKEIRNKQLIDDVITRFTKAIIPVNHQ